MVEGEECELIAHKVVDEKFHIDNILTYAIGELEDVVLCGRHKDGSMYFASSLEKTADVNWRLDQFKHILMER